MHFSLGALENSTCDPLKYTLGSPIIIASNMYEYKWLKDCVLSLFQISARDHVSADAGLFSYRNILDCMSSLDSGTLLCHHLSFPQEFSQEVCTIRIHHK